jgi:REP element-mobilizing transposase RayT
VASHSGASDGIRSEFSYGTESPRADSHEPPPGHAAGMDEFAYGRPSRRRLRCGPAAPVHFLTVVTEGRVRHFFDPAVAHAVCRAIREPGCWPGASAFAWVLMPDHWHGLVRLGRDTRLEACVATFRSRTARAAGGVDARVGALWSAVFHDRAIRSDSELLGAARYLVANPVRAGLVARVGAYPFWHGAAGDAGHPADVRPTASEAPSRPAP